MATANRVTSVSTDNLASTDDNHTTNAVVEMNSTDDATTENAETATGSTGDNAGNTSSKDETDRNTSFVAAIKDVILSFWPLGLVAFGGPTAHIAILHERFVESKQWLSDEIFLELLAVGQGLPGPTSTQMVISCGAYRGGILGGLISFTFWNLPSFIILTLAGLGVSNFIGDTLPFWMKGLPPAAVSLVFVAAFKLSAKVIDSKLKVALCIISTMVVLILDGERRGGTISAREVAVAYPILIFSGGLFTFVDSKIEKWGRSELYKKHREKSETERIITTLPYMNKYTSILLIIVWAAVLITFLVVRGAADDSNAKELGFLFESFFRIGSIIYGGGQVVLPMLLTEVVDPGWITEDQFWTGFALVQALPGPLFNFSAYLGAVGFGIAGAFIGWMGLFGPGILLIFAFLPLWSYVPHHYCITTAFLYIFHTFFNDWIHSIANFRIFLQGVNATAIGLVIAACVVLYEGAVDNLASASVAVLTASMVGLFGIPAPVAIVVGGIVGMLLTEEVLNLAQADLCVCDDE